MTQQKSIASIEKEINQIMNKLESRAKGLNRFQGEVYSLLNKTENDRIFNKIRELSLFEPDNKKCAIELTLFLYEIKKDVFEGTKALLSKDRVAEFHEQVLLACANSAALFAGSYLLSLKQVELELLKGHHDAHSVN